MYLFLLSRRINVLELRLGPNETAVLVLLCLNC